MMATKISKNNNWILFCLIASLFLMLVLIRPIKASFIVLLNPILNHLPTADYQQNSFFYDPSIPLIYMVIAVAIVYDFGYRHCHGLNAERN